jgi:hypothetical protein
MDNKTKYKDYPVGTWLRNKTTGDLAQVAEENGDYVIKPDKPLSPVRYPMTQISNWQIEPKGYKLPTGSYARVAFEADRILCSIHPQLKKQPEWNSLKATDRASWIEGRVEFQSLIRTRLYTAIIKTLEDIGD